MELGSDIKMQPVLKHVRKRERVIAFHVETTLREK